MTPFTAPLLAIWRTSPSTPKSQGTSMLMTLPSTPRPPGPGHPTMPGVNLKENTPVPVHPKLHGDGKGLPWPWEGSEPPYFAHVCAHQHMLVLCTGHTRMPQPARLEAEPRAPAQAPAEGFRGLDTAAERGGWRGNGILLSLNFNLSY